MNKGIACLMGTQMWLKGCVGYFYGIFFSKDFSQVPGEGCTEVFPQTHPDV